MTLPYDQMLKDAKRAMRLVPLGPDTLLSQGRQPR